MTTKVRCPKCNGFGNFILNNETNETSCKDCGVVFNKLTTKEKLEQLGWIIPEDEFEIGFSKVDKIDFISYDKKCKIIDFSTGINTINHTELQLILNYIEEQENDK